MSNLLHIQDRLSGSNLERGSLTLQTALQHDDKNEALAEPMLADEASDATSALPAPAALRGVYARGPARNSSASVQGAEFLGGRRRTACSFRLGLPRPRRAETLTPRRA